MSGKIILTSMKESPSIIQYIIQLNQCLVNVLDTQNRLQMNDSMSKFYKQSE